MSKILGKRFDDDFFNHLSIIDWRYYEAMIAKDEEESDARLIQLADYVATFINPQAVAAARKARLESDTTNNGEIGGGHGSSEADEFVALAQKIFNSNEGPKEVIDG